MARNQFPMMKSGGGVVSKLIGLAVVAALVTVIVKYPNEAAGWFGGALDTFGGVIDGFANFLKAAFGA